MNAELVPSAMPTSERCPLGSLGAHTYNYERDECIWCGPNGLAWKPGRWVDVGNGFNAWSVVTPPAQPSEPA